MIKTCISFRKIFVWYAYWMENQICKNCNMTSIDFTSGTVSVLSIWTFSARENDKISLAMFSDTSVLLLGRSGLDAFEWVTLRLQQQLLLTPVVGINILTSALLVSWLRFISSGDCILQKIGTQCQLTYCLNLLSFKWKESYMVHCHL